MSTFTYTYTFVNGTVADGGQVNKNLNDIKTFVTTDVLHRDGSVAMTNQLALQAGSDPTADDHAARKAYVDRLAGTSWTTYTPTWTSGGPAQPNIGNGTLIGGHRTHGTMTDLFIFLQMGSTSSGGNGILYFGLPVAPYAGWPEQTMHTKMHASAQGGNGNVGFAVLSAGVMQCSLHFLLGMFTTNWNWWWPLSNTDGTGASNTGCPRVNPFPLTNNSNLILQGSYRTS